MTEDIHRRLGKLTGDVEALQGEVKDLRTSIRDDLSELRRNVQDIRDVVIRWGGMLRMVAVICVAATGLVAIGYHVVMVATSLAAW